MLTVCGSVIFGAALAASGILDFASTISLCTIVIGIETVSAARRFAANFGSLTDWRNRRKGPEADIQGFAINWKTETLSTDCPLAILSGGTSTIRTAFV